MFDWGYIEVTSGWTLHQGTTRGPANVNPQQREDARGKLPPVAALSRWIDKSGWHHVAFHTMHMIIGTFINVFI